MQLSLDVPTNDLVIIDVVTERDVLRDENFVADARLKLGERALELLAVVVGREQGAQGARPEPVVNGEVPDDIQAVEFLHGDTRVEIVAQASGMLSKLGLGLGLGSGSGSEFRVQG